MGYFDSPSLFPTTGSGSGAGAGAGSGAGNTTMPTTPFTPTTNTTPSTPPNTVTTTPSTQNKKGLSKFAISVIVLGVGLVIVVAYLMLTPAKYNPYAK